MTNDKNQMRLCRSDTEVVHVPARGGAAAASKTRGASVCYH